MKPQHECPQCGETFGSYKASARFCSIACRREWQATRCDAGHDLTLPGAKRVRGKAKNRCTECEKLAGERWRRRIGKKPREEFLAEVKDTPEERRRKRNERATKYRRLAGAKPRTATKRVEAPRPIPTELSRAWGRAGYGSMMKRKYPTREALVAAYRRGDVPDPASSRLEA